MTKPDHRTLRLTPLAAAIFACFSVFTHPTAQAETPISIAVRLDGTSKPDPLRFKIPTNASSTISDLVLLGTNGQRTSLKNSFLFERQPDGNTLATFTGSMDFDTLLGSSLSLEIIKDTPAGPVIQALTFNVKADTFSDSFLKDTILYFLGLPGATITQAAATLKWFGVTPEQIDRIFQDVPAFAAGTSAAYYSQAPIPYDWWTYYTNPQALLDTPPQISPLTLVVTDTSINATCTLTDSDGVRNTTFNLYGGSGSLLASSSTGSFGGLSAETTYRVEMVAEYFNRFTNTWVPVHVAADTTTSAAVITPTPPATNHNPVANADSSTTAFNTPVTANVLINDTDSDVGDVLVISGTPTVAGGAATGTVSVGAGGNLTFTPATGFTGAATVNYVVSDGHGGTANGVWTVTVSAAVDSTPPTTPVVTINGGATHTNQTGVTYTASSTDANGIAKWLINGVESASLPVSLATTGADGVYTFTFIAKDPAGNASSPTVVSVTKDTTRPTTPVANLNLGMSVTKENWVSFGASSTDSSGIAKWLINGVESSSVPSSVSTAGADGLYSFCVEAKDPAGNISNPTCVSVTKDTVVSAVDISIAPAFVQGASVSQSLTLGSEPVKVVSGNTIGGVVIGPTGVYSTSTTITGAAGAAGSYSGNILLEDAAGNQKTIAVSLTII